MAKKSISIRLSKEAMKAIEDIMTKYNINQTEAIHQLILSSGSFSEVPAENRKGLILQFIANSETIMSNIPQSKNLDFLWEKIEEFKCQMLSL